MRWPFALQAKISRDGYSGAPPIYRTNEVQKGIVVKPAINSSLGRQYIQRIERRVAHLEKRISESQLRTNGSWDAAERNALLWALEAIDELASVEIERGRIRID